MKGFKLTKKNLLMLKDMVTSFDLIKNIVFAEEMHVLPYSPEQKLEDIKAIYERFGKDWGNG